MQSLKEGVVKSNTKIFDPFRVADDRATKVKRWNEGPAMDNYSKITKYFSFVMVDF